MRKDTPTALTDIKERVARVKWTRRNVWLRPCHGRYCAEHNAA